MEIWYKVSANDFNVTRGSTVFEDFYKENGIRKVIEGYKSVLKECSKTLHKFDFTLFDQGCADGNPISSNLQESWSNVSQAA